ncbi:hypothetical protein [Vibrio metoecus]|uniref:hypothetical protein n=1 Tax=Vibrio metoecus TaxID=1481663 RepID=UPI000BA9A841|nr:hypothetical protein [Vibrio metoecus]PAR47845.1 hypothetical protein CGT95_03645 [Vibrio metoecus]
MRFDVNLTIMKITHVDREADSSLKKQLSAMCGSKSQSIEDDTFNARKYRRSMQKLAIPASFVLGD